MDRPTRPSPTATSSRTTAPDPASEPADGDPPAPAVAPLRPWHNPRVDELVDQARDLRRRADRAPFRWSVSWSDDDVIDLRDDGAPADHHDRRGDQPAPPAWSAAVREAVARAETATPRSLQPDVGAGRGAGDGGDSVPGGPVGSRPGPGSDSGRSGGDPTRSKPVNRSRVALEWMVVFAVATLVTLTLQLTTFQVFAIPSESMTPTLEVGDRVVINKWAYRFGDVHRGDIVVFTKPEGAEVDGSDLIKRVVAVAGDTLTIADGHVLIDGVPLEESYLPPGTVTVAAGTFPCDPAKPCVIPPGQVFVMGDNRDASADSRVFGPIPTSSILGQVELRLLPLSEAGRL